MTHSADIDALARVEAVYVKWAKRVEGSPFLASKIIVDLRAALDGIRVTPPGLGDES